jgi:hypothetical protein
VGNGSISQRGSGSGDMTELCRSSRGVRKEGSVVDDA